MTTSEPSVEVLFVCMGNICRSPTGEGVFRHYVESRGAAERVLIDSAGTISYHAGAPADSRMREAASHRGYTLDSVARAVTAIDLEHFDLIVAMDHDNHADLKQLAGSESANIRMLGAFIPGVHHEAEAPAVPDPYYGGSQGFEEVIDMIEQACPALFQYCLNLLAVRD